MNYYHVDVFSDKKFSGNGLTVFMDEQGWDRKFMQILTQEMRQFESIFFRKTGANDFRAFIFTTEEELDFAGHPIIGGAAILHDLYSPEMVENTWRIELNKKSVEVNTYKRDGIYSAKMNQGKPEFIKTLSKDEAEKMLDFLNLKRDDNYKKLPCQVISTGLPYLILPVNASALQKVKVTVSDLENELSRIGAKFFFVLDIENRQGRTWDNKGLVEDIATGSAAGPVGAYLVEHGIESENTEIILKQGEFLNRPSRLKVLVTKEKEGYGEIFVEGDVCKIATGSLVT